jgi:hypothetical protein
MKAKKIITSIIGTVMFFNTVNPVCVNSFEIIEPTVIRAEMWYANCYVDTNKNVMYPCIRCEADIFNNGVVNLYMTYDYAFDPNVVSNSYIQTVSTVPVCTDSKLYAFHKSIPYTDPKNGVRYVPCSGTEYGTYKNQKFSELPNVTNVYRDWDISYYPTCYTYSGMICTPSTSMVRRWQDQFEKVYYMFIRSDSYEWETAYSARDAYKLRYDGNIYENTGESVCEVQTFTPNREINSPVTLHLYGHDITVEPDIVNYKKNMTDEEKDTYIQELEQQIQELRESNELLALQTHELHNRIALLSQGTTGDINSDEIVDITDVQLLLRYYTETEVAGKFNKDSVDVWYMYRFGKG